MVTFYSVINSVEKNGRRYTTKIFCFAFLVLFDFSRLRIVVLRICNVFYVVTLLCNWQFDGWIKPEPRLWSVWERLRSENARNGNASSQQSSDRSAHHRLRVIYFQNELHDFNAPSMHHSALLTKIVRRSTRTPSSRPSSVRVPIPSKSVHARQFVAGFIFPNIFRCSPIRFDVRCGFVVLKIIINKTIKGNYGFLCLFNLLLFYDTSPVCRRFFCVCPFFIQFSAFSANAFSSFSRFR